MDQGQRQPDRERRETGRRARICRAHDHEQKTGRQDELGDKAGHQRIAARRVLAIAVAGKTSGKIEAGLATGDQIKDQRCKDRAGKLSQDVGQQLPGRSATAGEQPDSHRGVEMTARDMADRIGHRHDGQSESQRNADQANADFGEFGGQHGTAAPAQNEPEGPEKLGSEFFV